MLAVTSGYGQLVQDQISQQKQKKVFKAVGVATTDSWKDFRRIICLQFSVVLQLPQMFILSQIFQKFENICFLFFLYFLTPLHKTASRNPMFQSFTKMKDLLSFCSFKHPSYICSHQDELCLDVYPCKALQNLVIVT